MEKRSLLLVLMILAVMAFARTSSADPIIKVYPSVAPNAFGSPYWSAYESSAVSALISGSSSGGISGTPGYYSQVPNGAALPVGAFTVTNFNSWLGDANPGATFGANYAGEYGNRVTYGLHITSDAPFSISQLAFNLTYDDANYSNYSVFSVAAGSYNYTTGYVGLNYGGDGMKGTIDDVWITGGLNTQPVNELFGRGSGLGYEVLTSFPGATNQDKIDQYNLATWGTEPFTFTGTYTLNGTASGAAFVAFNTPEPASIALWGLMGAAGLEGWRKRKMLARKS